MDPSVQTLAIQLSELALRNTAGAIADRITAARTGKKADQTISELEQIINELISDKSELVRVSQAFEETLVAQRISDAEVSYISQTVVPLVRKLVEAGAAGDTDAQTAGTEGGIGSAAEAKTRDVMEIIETLASQETVTTLQLLGFNFKRAIGEPLTDLVSSAIQGNSIRDPHLTSQLQLLNAQREVELYKIAQDPESFGRLLQIAGGT